MITSLLVIVAAGQGALSLLLLGPRFTALPLSKLLKSLRDNAISRTVLVTIAVALAAITATAVYDLSTTTSESVSANPTSKLLAAIDNYRAQITALLSVASLLLLAVNINYGVEQHLRDYSEKNFDALKRQVKGLQAEYTRATSTVKDSKEELPSEAATLKKQIDKLIQEKLQLQSEIENSAKSQKAAEAKLEALLSQVKGMDREFDRVLDENRVLQSKVAQYEGAPRDKKTE